MANRVELVARSAWDCYKVENGFSAPLPVRVAALGRRKKREHLGFLCLGLGLGFPGLVSGSGSGLVSVSIFGSVFGLGSESVGPISKLVSGSSLFSHPDLAEASMVVDEQIQLEEAASMVFDGEEASSTVFDKQIRLEEAPSTVSDCSDKGSGSSTASAFSDLC